MEGGPPTGNSGYHPSWMILCIVTQLFHIYNVCFSSITYHLVDDDSCCCCTCKRDANECQPGSLSLFSLLSYKPYCTVQIHLGVLCTYILDVWEMLILFRLSFPYSTFFLCWKEICSSMMLLPKHGYYTRNFLGFLWLFFPHNFSEKILPLYECTMITAAEAILVNNTHGWGNRGTQQHKLLNSGYRTPSQNSSIKKFSPPPSTLIGFYIARQAVFPSLYLLLKKKDSISPVLAC